MARQRARLASAARGAGRPHRRHGRVHGRPRRPGGRGGSHRDRRRPRPRGGLRRACAGAPRSRSTATELDAPAGDVRARASRQRTGGAVAAEPGHGRSGPGRRAGLRAGRRRVDRPRAPVHPQRSAARPRHPRRAARRRGPRPPGSRSARRCWRSARATRRGARRWLDKVLDARAVLARSARGRPGPRPAGRSERQRELRIVGRRGGLGVLERRDAHAEQPHRAAAGRRRAAARARRR